MIYLLDIQNRLAWKAKGTSIASNQQSAIHFPLFLLRPTIFVVVFFVLRPLRRPICFEPLSAIECHFIFSSNHLSFLLSEERL